jgi:hypothetical protein
MQDGGLCTFAFAGADGAFKTIGKPFQAVEGMWIGAKIGIYCRATGEHDQGAHADFDYFRFSPPASK